MKTVLSADFLFCVAVCHASSGYIDVDGGKLYYEEAGSGPAELVVHPKGGKDIHAKRLE